MCRIRLFRAWYTTGEMVGAEGKIGQVTDSLRVFARNHPKVSALYLFGSQAKGRAGRLSDWDVAVLLEDSRGAARGRFPSQLELVSEIAHACGEFDVDVVLLNEASPLLAYEVVREGRLLYEADHDQRVAFEARTVQHYLDLVPFYRVGRLYLKRQLLQKTG